MSSLDVDNCLMGHPCLPGTSKFSRHIQQYAGKKVYFHIPAGNWGDRLIALGGDEVLRQSGVSRCDDPASADLILINGGGAFNRYWFGAAEATRDLRQQNPHVPMIVGPQSYTLDDEAMVGRMKQILALQAAPITFYAREVASYETVRDCIRQSGKDADIALSQDLAFELEGSEWLSQRRACCSEKTVVVGLRGDVESPFPMIRWIAWHQRSAQWNHRLVRTFFWKCVRRTWQATRWLVVRKVMAKMDASQYQRVVNRDISAIGTFEQFIEHVEEAGCLIVDRLHSAIYGYLLRKPVALLVSDHYHKIKGVYRFSMDNPESTVSLFDIKANRIH